MCHHRQRRQRRQRQRQTKKTSPNSASGSKRFKLFWQLQRPNEYAHAPQLNSVAVAAFCCSFAAFRFSLIDYHFLSCAVCPLIFILFIALFCVLATINNSRLPTSHSYMAHNKGHNRARSERRQPDRARDGGQRDRERSRARTIFLSATSCLLFWASRHQRWRGSANKRDANTTVSATIGDALTNLLMRLLLADARHAHLNNKQTTCVSVYRTESEFESNT